MLCNVRPLTERHALLHDASIKSDLHFVNMSIGRGIPGPSADRDYPWCHRRAGFKISLRSQAEPEVGLCREAVARDHIKILVPAQAPLDVQVGGCAPGRFSDRM